MKYKIPTSNELIKSKKELQFEIQTLKKDEHSFDNFKFYFDNAQDLICIFNPELEFREMNPSFLAKLGYSEENLYDTPFINLVHPEDHSEICSQIDKLSIENSIIFETRFLHKNGKYIHLQWSACKNPSNTNIYAFARDVSESKRIQQKLITSENFLNDTQIKCKIGSWELNLITQDLKWSNELYSIFEISKNLDKSKLYSEYLSRFVPEDIEILNQKIADCISSREPYEMEHRILLLDNKVKWVYCNGIPVEDINGEVFALRGIVQDITEKKRLDETIKAKEYAEAANMAKSDFLANMSHEIRTPLNGIIGFTDLLMKTNIDKNQSEYLTIVNESATTLMEIIKDILDFSKIESGKIELDIQETDLIELSHQVIDLFKYQANKKRIDLILNIDSSVPQYILADSTRLKQILVNLLSNAIKFTSFGQIQLDINELVNERKGFSTIKFSVKDTGIGIKKANQERIFDSFMQADNSTTRKFGGTGLGLTISNQLLGLVNSELELISKYGEGSDFYFSVEFEVSTAKKYHHTEVNNTIKKEKGSSSLFQQCVKILVVEDNNINMLLVKTLLKIILPNCNIIEAADGKQAIEQFKKQQLDIILMDIQMPIKNGYEATNEIRKIDEDIKIPIIALTAGIMAGEKEKCLNSGMDDYISKPIIRADLEQMLQKWITQEA